MFTREGRTDMSLRDVTIAQMGNGATECGWRHALEARRGLWEESWVESCLRRRRLTFACSRRPCDRCARDGRGRWKSQNRKNVYLSPYVEEPLNAKVIKSFVPELRSCYVFCVLRFLCSMYICYEHSMYVLHICIMGM